MDTSKAEVGRLRQALNGSKEEAEDIQQQIDAICRVWVIRLRLYLSRTATLTIRTVSDAVGVPYQTLYRKLGLWADRSLSRRLETDEADRIVAAVGLPSLDRCATVDAGTVVRLVGSAGVEITRDELAEAIGADAAAALFEGGHITINERGHVAPGRKG